jgi:hypothetical protein
MRRWSDVIAAVGALIVLIVLAALRTSGERPPSVPSTYDTGPSGFAALYELLQREGVRAVRMERPFDDLRDRSAALVIAGDAALDDATEQPGTRQALDAWVQRGGMLVVLDGAIAGDAVRRALAIPSSREVRRIATVRAGCAFARDLRGRPLAGTFESGFEGACSGTRATVAAAGRRAIALAYAHGAGTIVVSTTTTLLDNLHLGQAANASAAYALFAGRSAVFFDERVHGYRAGRTFWDVMPRTMRIAIVLALITLLAAIIGANLPFAPAYAAPPAGERDSSAYIDSLARLLERGGAAAEAVARIAAYATPLLEPRAAGDERARMLLRELRALEATPRPESAELLKAGRIFARVRKDYR